MIKNNFVIICVNILIISILTLNFSKKILADYSGSGRSGNIGFWHTDKINKIQLGWDKRIYIYVNNTTKCGSDLIWYHHDIKIGREMILMALLNYEDKGRQVSFRIDECGVTKNNVRYGLFDKIEASSRKPIYTKYINWFSNLLIRIKNFF